MARIDSLSNFLTDVAESIRGKTGKTDSIACSDFDTEIESISTGGDLPAKCYSIEEWTSHGFPKVVRMIGYTDTNMTKYLLSGSPFTSMTDLIISSDCNSIGYFNCGGDTGLTTVTIESDSVTLNQGAFSGCTSLTTFPFEKINNKNLPSNTFYNCSKLTGTTLPDTVVGIGSQCFSGCTSLNLTSLPTNLVSIGTLYGSGSGSGSTFYNCTNLAISSIPDDCGMSGDSNFRGCSNITVAKLPSSWAKTLDSTFYGCTSITSMDFANVTTVGSSAFQGCTSLSSVNLNNVTTIGNSAFRGCTSLASVDLNNITTIDACTFMECTSLENITTTDSITSIKAQSFYGCTSLKKILLPSLTTLVGTYSGNGSFYNCTNLKKIWLGESIATSLPRYVFCGCSSLEAIYINLPRATVEAFTNYKYAFMNDTSKTGLIICNDDDGFLTKEEFDALEVS